MKQPCVRNCPNRSGTCHKTCPEWKEYEAAKFEEYKQRQIEYNHRNESHSYRTATMRRFRNLILEV